MSVTLRAARADDAVKARNWIHAASGGFLKFVFGLGRDEPRALDFVERAFRASSGPLSHAHAVVAEIDGVPAGMALAFAARAKPRIDRALVPLLWRHYSLTELARLARNGLRANQFQAGIPHDSFYLSILGVDDDRRGHGIGSRLLDDVFVRARASRCTECMLHVSVHNTGARRLYERQGFVVSGELRDVALERSAGIDGQWMMRRAV